MPSLASVTSHLDAYLSIAEIPDSDRALNGLQVENTGGVQRVLAAVDASLASIERAAALGSGTLLLVHHGLFQTYFFASHLGLDPNARDRFKGDPAYERTVEFCAKYDEVSFDPRYPNEPLSTFEPMGRKLLAKAWVAPQ